MYFYTAYGLLVQSELELPELLAVSSPPTTRVFDVTIRVGSVESRPPGPQLDGFYHVTPNVACGVWRDVGLTSIVGGNEITVEPRDGVDLRIVRLCLLGSAFSVLLHQRGFLVLHASAVALGSIAVGFMGNCGAGKSTTAASLHARGWPLLSDDVIAVATGGDVPRVHSAYPHLKLCPDAAEVFSKDLQTLATIHPDEDKRLRPALEGFTGDTTLPVRRLYLLQDADKLEIAPVPLRDAFPALISNSFTAHLLESTDARRPHFEQCARLLETVPIKALRRPRDLSAIDRLAELVEADAHE